MTLPQFCLSYTESRLVWGGFKPPLPPRYARFSLGRVLLFTVGQTLLGAVIGWAMAVVLGLLLHRAGPFVLFNGPFSWIIVLATEFSAAQGIIGYGVTALCWNQRAARLQANPSMPTDLPKARFRIFRWGLGLVYFLLLAIVTPAAMLITVENIRGELAWKREHARLVANGEKLTLEEVLGAPVPAAQNAGAAPVFTPLFDYHREGIGAQRHAVWSSSNALDRVQNALKGPQGLHFRDKSDRDSLRTPEVKLANWSAAVHSMVAKPSQDDPSWARELKLPEPRNPVSDVRAALKFSEPVLSEICAASALPHSRFPLHYDEALEALLPHLPLLKGASVLLQLRCTANLESGDLEAAFADATNALNVAELLRDEPLLISQLVREAQGHFAISTLWQGLAAHRWNDAQLATFQERLSRIDYFQGLMLAMEGERAWSILSMERLISNPSGRPFDDNLLPSLPSRMLSVIPRGMLHQNEVALMKYFSANLDLFRRQRTNSATAGFEAFFDDGGRDRLIVDLAKGYSPYNALAAMLAPAWQGATKKTARIQTTVQLAIVACALERCRIAHGSYPETLESLAPQFIVQVPLDPVVNKPFHYRRTDDGWFTLYSVGPNGTDDGGVLQSDVKKDKEDKDWPWPVPTRPQRRNLF